MGLPPYRLNTVDDVKCFVADSRRQSYRNMLKFARGTKIRRPPVLSRMPEKVSLKVYDIRRDVRKIVEDVRIVYDLESATDILREVRKNFLKVVKNAPENYFDMVPQQVGRLKVFLGGGAWNETSSHPKSITQRAVALIDEYAALYALLSDLLKRSINTKNEAARKLLKDTLLLLLAYQRETFQLDHNTIENLSSLDDNSSLLLAETNKIFGQRLDDEKRKVFNPCLYSYLGKVKGKALQVRCPPFFKQNVLVLMDELAEHRDIKRARHKWKKLVDVYRDKISAGQLKKMKSLLDNFLSKLRQFDDFFNVTLRAGEIKDIYKMYGRPTVRTVITQETVATGVELVLYPCKDYHDFLKGHYSGDCTTRMNLAAGHLLNKRFFNIRIFRGTDWIGNIYCLDYTDRDNALIIDRIQIERSTQLMPVKFFPRFMDVVLKKLLPGGHVAVLGPPRISNYKSIEKSYASYVAGKQAMKFKFARKDVDFACSGRTRLYVLA